MKPIFLSKSQREQLDVQQQQHSKPQVQSRSPKQEKEVEAIQEQKHLVHTTKPRMRVLKPTQKFRFTFDWDTGEQIDVSLDDDDADALFGRGFSAGMERVEQKKTKGVVNQDWTKQKLE